MTSKSIIIQYGHIRGPEGEDEIGPADGSTNTTLLAIWNIECEEADKYTQTALKFELTPHDEDDDRAQVFIAPAKEFPYDAFGITNDDLMQCRILPPEENKQAWIAIVNG